MTPRRVLFVGNDASRSGAPMVLLHLIRWLKLNTDWKLGLVLPGNGPLLSSYAAEVPVALLDGPLATSKMTHRIARRIGRKLGIERSAQRRRVDRALNLISGGPPDIIYCNSVAAANLLDQLGPFKCPVVMHVHELEYVLTHMWWLPDAVGKMKRHATHYIACAQIVKQNLIDRHEIPADRITVVHAFIPVAARAACASSGVELLQTLGLAQGSLVVGVVGSVEWRKGSDWFLPIARLVIDRNSELRISFVWIGGGAVIERQQLEYDISVAGLSDRIKLVGATDRVNDWYQLFDVFALPSREDPFPLVCLEAAASGVPIVCFANAGGMSEFVEQDCGCIVTYGDLSAFADAVSRIITDRQMRDRLGATAAVKVRNRHDLSVAAPLILDCLRHLPIS